MVVYLSLRKDSAWTTLPPLLRSARAAAIGVTLEKVPFVERCKLEVSRRLGYYVAQKEISLDDRQFCCSRPHRCAHQAGSRCGAEENRAHLVRCLPSAAGTRRGRKGPAVRTAQSQRRNRRSDESRAPRRARQGRQAEQTAAKSECARLSTLPAFSVTTSEEWSDHRDCHIRPDLVLIYRKPDDDSLELVRLGSHSELGL